jgi:spermidine/putrescine transport system ATP-binding protein
MQVELKRIQETVGITFVYVTHDQEEALSMSDRVAVMSSGHIEQLDEPRAIYDRPLTPFVAEFIGEMNFFKGEVTASGDGTFTVAAGSDVSIHGRGEAPKGERVTVGIRSERMIAVPGTGAPIANSAAAEVLTKMYLGDQIQIVARLAGGSSVILREQRAGADPALDTIQPGDGITVSWDETAPHVMQTADPSAADPKEEP